jgi:hypothetical protein
VRRLRQLTRRQQDILVKMSRIGWGTVENLVFQDGEPVARPAPKIRRNIRLRGKAQARPADPPDDYELKDEQIEFVTFLEQQRSGCISRIDVRDGLPAEMSVDEVD